MKKIIIILTFVLSALTCGQQFYSGRARGLFFSIAVGPRFPISDFSNSHTIGAGVNAGISYTDNEYLPLFFYARIGFEHYPGSINFYQHSDYSAIATNNIPMNLGIKLFFPPIVEDIVLLMPTVELGGLFAVYERSHQFKSGSGRNNYIEQATKFGFQAGAGFSMFLLEVMTYYNYQFGNQNIAVDLKVRIPIFIKL
jgi:opacity protein-like surface antigen